MNRLAFATILNNKNLCLSFNMYLVPATDQANYKKIEKYKN
jgi:hypothetical protein